MPPRYVQALFLLSLVALLDAMPQGKDDSKDSFLGLPFIQLTNGGIRFNFAGYHAEAGLGGLLGESRAGGGLHASAGTPWGANAAAGLGGALGGDDASAGGGLYARAGLGEGRPQASAGLGGSLSGSGQNPPATGGLFAGATTGNAGAASSQADASASGGTDDKKSSGRTNVQFIARSDKHAQKSQETRREIQQGNPGLSAAAGLFGAIFAEPTSGGHSVVKSVEKFKATDGEVKRIEQASHVSSFPAPAEVPSANNANAAAQADATVTYVRPAHSRWYLRKRFWARAPQKRVIYASVADDDLQANLPGSGNNRRIVKRQIDDSGERPRQRPSTDEPQRRNGGIFDDIFNIPQSTLTAVNGLFQRNPA